jgi:hypothetical protein
VALTTKGINFNEFKLGSLQEPGTWEPSQYLLEDRKTKKTCAVMAKLGPQIS